MHTVCATLQSSSKHQQLCFPILISGLIYAIRSFSLRKIVCVWPKPSEPQFNTVCNINKSQSADPSGVERVGESENANYPIPYTHHPIPYTPYPIPNTHTHPSLAVSLGPEPWPWAMASAMAWGLGTLPGAWGHDPIPFAISLGPEPWPWPWA